MHPSILHIGDKEKVTQKDQRDGEQNNAELSNTSDSCTTSSACSLTGAGHCNGIVPILPVMVKCSKGNKVIESYGFLDPGSTGAFCTRKLIDKLNMEGRKFKIHIRTLGYNKAESSVVDSLEISGLSGECFYPLPKCVPRKRCPSLQPT